MSEEEKKAIEYWKRDIEFYHLNTQLASEHYAQIILNLIEKQQKEIEALNEIKQQICNEELITQDYVQDNFIAKDKIRETLKKYDKDIAWANADDHYYFVKYIKELLEEN